MRFLIINQCYTFGGTEVQTKREFKQFKQKGHQVMMITLDPNLSYHESKEEGHINVVNNYTDLKLDIHRFIEDKKLTAEVRKIVIEFNPDYIHLNNIFYSPISIYKAIRGYKAFQTIRDFRVVCPKNTCIFEDGNTCKGYKYEHCLKTCGFQNIMGIPKMILKLGAIKLQEKYRKSTCKQFACPSQCLTDYCNAHSYRTTCINNPFDIKILTDFHKRLNINKKIILFYGALSRQKGVDELLYAFISAKEKINSLELHIIGSVADDIDVNLFERAQKLENIIYYGKRDYDFIIRKLQEVYAVIIPSLWMENYPNTALEGIATDCIVCGSNRGGIPEFIVEERCKFNVLNQDEIINTLVFLEKSTEEDYKRICGQQKELFYLNNTQERYYNRVIDLLSSL